MMCAVSNNLGNTTTSVSPPATRVNRPGWRDPRLWIGVLLVAVSVVGGARLLAAADDTVAVWAVASDMGAGATVTESDLEPLRLRFADDPDLGRYFVAEEGFPTEVMLQRSVDAGELLARSAVVPTGESDLIHLPLEVAPHQVPPAVTTGSVVDIYLSESVRSRASKSRPGPALEAVSVVAAPPVAESFAVTGARQLVVAVPQADAVAFEELHNALDSPTVRVLQRF